MSTVDYAEVLADLERRKADIETAIAAIRRLHNLPAASPAPANPPAYAPVAPLATPNPAPEGQPRYPFFGLTIPEASILHLRTLQQPQNTHEMIAALKNGGLRDSNYQTVYQVLRRRAREKQDIFVESGKWHLAEWHKWRRKHATRSDGATPIDRPPVASEN